VRTGRIHPRVREVLIEGDDNRCIYLRPSEDLVIGRTSQPDIVDVADGPGRFALPDKIADLRGNVLIE
jgi:hypothetical protein